MRDQGGVSTRQVGGATLTLFGIGLPLAQWGLEVRGVELTPAQGNILLALAALSFLAGLGLLGWHSIKAVWLRIRREKALREVERERDEARANYKTLEQGLEELGIKLTGDLDKQIAKTKQLTSELRNDRLEEELREAKQEAERFQRLYREAIEDEHGQVHWGRAEGGVNLAELAANAEAKKEIEELKAENERLRNEASSPEVAKQKRLCFHLAGQLRSLYEELLDGENLLDAQLQERREANVSEEELQEERRVKQRKLEGRIRNTYSYGFDDRLDKLYMELGSDGWLGPNDEDLFSSVRHGDPHDIKKVAERLDEVGRNLL